MSSHVDQLLAWFGVEPTTPPDRTALAEMLAAAGVPWAPCEPGGDYEAHVCAGRIPTRPGSWHDVFNAVAFARWPLTKAALHRRAYALRSQRSSKGHRTPAEDALALLDEAALVFDVDEVAVGPLARARAHGDLDAIDRLVQGGIVRVMWFGHALLEHALLRRAPIGAGVVLLPRRAGGVAAWHHADAALATAIAPMRGADAWDRPRFSPTLPWPDVRVDRWLCQSWAAAPLPRRGDQLRP